MSEVDPSSIAAWFLPPGVKPRIIKARKRMYDRLTELTRQRYQMEEVIFYILNRDGLGKELPWNDRYDIIRKAVDDHIAAWEDVQLDIEPPEPRTELERALQDHHRLLWAEWNLCDDIENEWGAVSPFHDSRPVESRNPGANSIANLRDTPRSAAG